MERGAGADLARARKRLWLVTFTVLTALAGVLIYVTSAEATGQAPSFLPSRSLLAVGLAGALMIFGLYVFDSERKLRALADRLTEERNAAQRMQEEQMEQRDFVSMAAHELRAPLTAIKGFTRTLMTRFDRLEEEKRNEYLSLVNEQSNRLARLVDDLAAVSRIDSGRVHVERAPVDLALLCRSVCDEFRSKWPGREIEVRAPSTLPAASADRHRIEEVLVNLIDNAVKYSLAPEPVVVTVGSFGGHLEVSITDHGPGMTAEEAASLFAKFRRLPSALAREIPGTGLGLYIVRGWINAHGGTIEIDSTPGEGSTFRFTLPAAEVALNEPAAPSPAVGAARAS
ncbi:MAG: sensor histidine kinase [Actinomycetota bacterium]